MAGRHGRALRLLRHGFEPVLVAVAVGVLYLFGIVEEAALWLGLPLLLAGMIYQQPDVQHRLSGGDFGKRLALRLWVHMGLVTAFIFALGWGAVGAIAHLNMVSLHLKLSGSRAWRPAVAASIGTIVMGDVLVMLGVFHTYLPLPEGHVVSVLAAIGTATTARSMGLNQQQQESDQRALRESEERFRILVQDGTEIITVSDADTVIRYISPSVVQSLGYTVDEMVGKRYVRLTHPESAAEIATVGERVLADRSGSGHRAEIRVRHADGSWRWHELILRNMLEHPAVRGVVGHHRDITQRRADQEKVEYAAMHDALTGLVNPMTFKVRLERALAQPGRDHAIGLLFLDLDGFKQVNDMYGHQVGDRLLSVIGAAIRDNTLGTDIAGRLGGDEFGVVLTRIDGHADAVSAAVTVAQRIIGEIDRDIVVDGHVVRVGCSIGIAVADPGMTDAQALTRNADAAMYASKRRNRNGYEVVRTPSYL
jgi:diguanylate cyclase (GGDEF)-like protein/PAS domain S-box-containing protein